MNFRLHKENIRYKMSFDFILEEYWAAWTT